MTKVFITGASGFIGQRLVKAITKEKVPLRVLSRCNQPGIETVVCDLQFHDIPANTLMGIDTVFHLAGIAHDSAKKDNQYQAVNVRATLQLAELAVTSGVERFVFLSSVKAGGNLLNNSCMDESDQGIPEGVYGRTKREAELKLLEIGRQSGMHVSIVRSSLVYGPLMKGNLQMMLSGIEKGWFPPLPEANNKRSMIHVDDLVRAILLVSNDKRADGEIFIVTDGLSYSSRQIYSFMRKAIGKPEISWSMPRAIFKVISLISPTIKYKIDKLFGNEYYSSKKIEKLGYKSCGTLKEMNKTLL